MLVLIEPFCSFLDEKLGKIVKADDNESVFVEYVEKTDLIVNGILTVGEESKEEKRFVEVRVVEDKSKADVLVGEILVEESNMDELVE